MNKPLACEWLLDGVLDEIEFVDRNMDDRQFAFILGAGASFTSGIPTANEFSVRWLNELHVREVGTRVSFEEWIASGAHGFDGLTLPGAATFYPQIFKRRFQDDPESGFAALEVAMEGKLPSLGYSLLAEVMQKTRHRVVITTNFDNLVADALAMHAHQAPLVVAHETLAGFVRPQLRRPLVAKIHRDLFLRPKNDPDGVGALEEAWIAALRRLFQYFTPIVVGYGGNDGSLMNLLAELVPGDIAGRMVWAYRAGSPIPDKAEQVIFHHGGIKTQIPGFDEFMLLAAARIVPRFDAADIADRTAKLGQTRADQYKTQTVELLLSLREGSAIQVATANVLAASVKPARTWWSWDVIAQAEPSASKRSQIYRLALEQFPDSAELHDKFGLHLVRNGRFDEAAEMYRKSLELNFSSQCAIRYAEVLTVNLQKPDEAERILAKAYEKRDDAAVAGWYAWVLDEQGKIEEAEEAFRTALGLKPGAATLANWAIFLMRRRNEFEAARGVFESVEAQGFASGTAIHWYAKLLVDKFEDLDVGERWARKGVELFPECKHNLTLLAEIAAKRQRDELKEAVSATSPPPSTGCAPRR